MSRYISKTHRRWGDNDKHFGPLTFSFRESWKPWAVIVSTGGGCHLRVSAFGFTMICELPPIAKPAREWVDLRRYEWASSDGYWQEHRREYGFTLNDGHLYVPLGTQTDDSSTTKSWSCFLPWTQWRQVSHRIFNANGSLAGEVANLPWDEARKVQDAATRMTFAFEDYDGQRLTADTYVEERVWMLGAGWFLWLGYLAPRKRRRSLDIRFSDEVGPEKGSWKGGTIGTGIEMMPGEPIQQAWLRFCQQEHRSKSGRYRIKPLTIVETSALNAEPGHDR